MFLRSAGVLGDHWYPEVRWDPLGSLESTVVRWSSWGPLALLAFMESAGVFGVH